jgi:hypothetical protein
MAHATRRPEDGVLLFRLVTGLLLAAALLRIFFWRYTGRTWEDALITVLHAENFWQGLGLTHVKPGEPPLHGFTSPVSVLIPLLAGVVNAAWGLAFQKLLSVVAAVGVVILGLRLLLRVDVAPGARLAWVLFSLGYVAIEHHQILWGMAGMETTVVTLALFFFFHACAVRSPRMIAVAMALALYARPDFLFLNLIGLAWCAAFLRRDLWRIVGLAFLLYLPWLAFTTLYYGSPIPHTIFAKLYGYTPGPSDFHKFLGFLVPLGPSFAGHGTGYLREWDGGAISILVFGLFLLGGYQVVARRVEALYVPAAFAAVYLAYYEFVVASVFGWYLAPLAAAIMLVAGYGLVTALPSPRAALAVALAYIFAMAAMLPQNFRAERGIQKLVETPVRTELGRFLGQAMGPGDFAGMEPLGYASYYSRRPIHDYPGLASRQVVAFLARRPRAGLCEMLPALQPRYVVLRPWECKEHAFLARDYELLREFKAPPAAAALKQAHFNVDRHFLVYRRKPGPG